MGKNRKKNQNEVSNYHKFVWAKSWNATIAHYRSNFQDWGGDVIAAIFTALASALFFYIGDGMTFDWLNIVLSTLIGGVCVFLFRLFSNGFWNIPSNLFRDKERKLELYTWNTAPISLHPFDIASGESGWAMRIENNKSIPMSVISKPVEVSNKGRVIFNEKGRWAFFRFINRRDGLTRERITSLREVRNRNEQKVFPFEMRPGEHIDFVLTRSLGGKQYVFETDQDKINGSPKNAAMKVKISGKVIFENSMYDLPTINLEILFDGEGIPEITSVSQNET